MQTDKTDAETTATEKVRDGSAGEAADAVPRLVNGPKGPGDTLWRLGTEGRCSDWSCGPTYDITSENRHARSGAFASPCRAHRLCGAPPRQCRGGRDPCPYRPARRPQASCARWSPTAAMPGGRWSAVRTVMAGRNATLSKGALRANSRSTPMPMCWPCRTPAGEIRLICCGCSRLSGRDVARRELGYNGA